MRLPEICIRRPVLASMMSLGLVLFGMIGISRLPVRELPDIDPPIVNVNTVYPGASAEVVETEITERLEEVINTIEGIKTLTSESREQVSSITVQFVLARDIDLAAQDVRDRVARAREDLPEEINEPIVAKQDGDARPFLWIALYGERYSTLELSDIGEEILKDPLQTIRGVSNVILGGEKRFAIRFWLDSNKMTAHGITVLDVEAALRSQNLELPSGRVENREREMAIQTLGELKTVDEFNRLVIREDGDNLIRLQDIGYAQVGVEDERSVARYNSKPAVGLGVVKQSKANTIDVANGIKAELERLKAWIPEGVEFFIAYDESTFVEKAIEEVWRTLFIAFILVVITIFIFLRNVRSTIIPSVAIPVAVTGVFAVLYLLGYSINIVTMMAMVLTIGVVVDDSIVVLENIYRHVEEGQKPMQAAIEGMKEIVFAVIATTVALVAVFLPMAFQTSLTGRLFIEFAIALAGAVIISSFVALTLTPMICARVLRPVNNEKHGVLFNLFERWMGKLSTLYERALGWSLNHRPTIVVASLIIVGLSGFIYTQLEQDFLPQEDKGRLFCLAIAPEGATSEYTDRMVRQMEVIMHETPGVGGFFSAVALGRGGPGKASQGLMFVRFQDRKDRDLSVQDIVDGPNGVGARFFNEVEGAISIPILPKAIGGGWGQSFQLVLQHDDLNVLSNYSLELANRLRKEGFLANVRTQFQLDKPELRINIDRNRAGVLGVSIRDLSRTLQILFGGQDLSQVQRGGKEYDVIVQLDRESRLTPSDIERLYIRNTEGELIQLSNVVNLEPGGGPNTIYHYNRSRSATVEGSPMGKPLGTAIDRAMAIVDETMPDGFRYTWAGDAKNMRESTANIYWIMVLALIVVFMVLAAQFESLLHPLTVMVAVPLAAFGAFGALYLLGWVNYFGVMFYGWANYAPDPPGFAKLMANIIPRIPAMNINLFSQIGFLLLIALATKNSILLVEFANQQMAKGKDAMEAIKISGKIRFRPILMTTFSTIAGILPIAIGFGAGAESRRPLGVVAVGGLITSTIFTLLVVPVVYSLFGELTRKLRSRSDEEIPQKVTAGTVPSVSTPESKEN